MSTGERPETAPADGHPEQAPTTSDTPTVSSIGESLPPSKARPLPTVTGYEVIGWLGEGGMGTVWRATQLATKRQVALKLLHHRASGSAKAQARFEREVELAARLEHPNIASVYDSGIHQGTYFYAMELIDGVPLDEYVKRHELNQRDILGVMQTVAEAVQHAHQRGIIHRDLKPSNILVDAEGRPHVLDFGLAKAMEEAASNVMVSIDGDVAGTPAFMSPEQAAGRTREIDTRSDVYSLGVILYRFLAGKSPHDLTGSRSEVLRRISGKEVTRPRTTCPDIDGELEALILKALRHDPSDRYAMAGDLAEDIASYLTGEMLTARQPTVWYFLRKRLRKYRVPLAAACAVVCVLLSMAALAYFRVRRERDRSIAAELTASQQRDIAQEQRRIADAEQHVNLERLIAESIRRGSDSFNDGDAPAAMLWYADALRLTYDRYGHLADQIGATINVRAMINSLEGHLPTILGVWTFPEPNSVSAFSRDLTRCAFVGHTRDTVTVYELATGNPIAPVMRIPAPIDQLTFLPEPNAILLACRDHAVRIARVHSGAYTTTPIAMNAIKTTRLLSLESPGARHLELSQNDLSNFLPTASAEVTVVTDKGDCAATVYGNIVWIWDLVSCRPAAAITLGHHRCSTAFIPHNQENLVIQLTDTDAIAYNFDSHRIRSLRRYTIIDDGNAPISPELVLVGPGVHVAWTPVLTAAASEETARTEQRHSDDPASTRPIRRLEELQPLAAEEPRTASPSGGPEVLDQVFTPDGNYVAMAYRRPNVVRFNRCFCRVYDTRSGVALTDRLPLLWDPDVGPFGPVISKDGSRICTGLGLWDVRRAVLLETWKDIDPDEYGSHKWNADPRVCRRAEFSADGSILITEPWHDDLP